MGKPELFIVPNQKAFKIIKAKLYNSSDTTEEAISDAYKNIKKINFDNMYYRTDIGKKGLVYLKGVSDE